MSHIKITRDGKTIYEGTDRRMEKKSFDYKILLPFVIPVVLMIGFFYTQKATTEQLTKDSVAIQISNTNQESRLIKLETNYDNIKEKLEKVDQKGDLILQEIRKIAK